ncbi:hypothetical protein EV182_006190, partial [Spiromyces aspiralis]
GGGAIAGLYGWRLQQAGVLTSVVCRSNYQAVRDSGYKVSSDKWGTGVFKPEKVYRSITEAVEDGDESDYVVLSTKAYPNIEDGSSLIAPVVKNRACSIVLMQNGVGIEDPYQKRFPNNPIISAVMFVDVTQPEHGVIEHGLHSENVFGLFPAPPAASTNAVESLAQLASLWKRGDVPCTTTEDIQSYRWHKVVWNASFNPMSVISGGNAKNAMVSHPYYRELVLKVMEEVWGAAKAVCGPQFPPPGVPQSSKAMFDLTANNPREVYPSMLLDYQNGRRMEHEVILKNTIERAKEHGFEMPRVETIYGNLLMLEELMFKNRNSNQQ